MSSPEKAEESRGQPETQVSPKKAWFSAVTAEFQRSHLMANTSISTALIFLEETTEREFWCPCKSEWNTLYSAAYFAVPAVLVFLLMLKIRGFKERLRERLISLFFCMVPSVVWFILLFYEGQYYACARTSWSGSYVSIDGVGSKRWCKPKNSSSSQELLEKSEQWFTESQVIGKGFVVVLTFLVGINLFYTNFKKKTFPDNVRSKPDNQDNQEGQAPDSDDILLQDMKKIADQAAL